jgi:hypothetical protein
MARPTAGFPDFAMNDVTDPSSGQPNVVEPSAGKKAGGFIYNEKPPRQYLNWMQRLNALWIRYFDSQYAEGTFKGRVNGSSPNFDKTFTYTKNGRIVTIFWPDMIIAANSWTSTSFFFEDINGDNIMPNGIRVADSNTHIVGFAGTESLGIGDFVGIIQMPNVAPSQLRFDKSYGTILDKTKDNHILAGSITYQLGI